MKIVRSMCEALAIAVIAGIGASGASAAENSDDRIFPPTAAAEAQSVAVVRVSDGKVLFEQNSDKLLSPASVTKIVTGATALTRFGSNHHFTTKFYSDGQRVGPVLHGNLVVVGDGDPFFVNEKLWQLAADFRHLGFREITGDIVIDNSLFQGPSRDRSRQEGEKQTSHAYDAPISAFGVNFNTYAVAMAPGSKVGEQAAVGLDPYKIQGISIENSLRTLASNQSSSLQVSRVTSANDQPRLVVRGGIPLNQGLKKIYRGVDDHVMAAGETLRAFLAREGIRVNGKVRLGTRPDSAELIYAMPGYDLGFIVNGLNAFSNNYIADVLVQRLGAEFGNSESRIVKGSLESGIQVITDFLQKDVGIKSQFELKNGSGLDAANRLSAAQLVQVLRYMESNFEVFPEFLASLAAAGDEGTMEKRFKSTTQVQLKAVIRAKTGSLSVPVAVASLAGYFRHEKHGLIAFAIIDNGVLGKPQPNIYDLRVRQDRALEKLWNTL